MCNELFELRRAELASEYAVGLFVEFAQFVPIGENEHINVPIPIVHDPGKINRLASVSH